MTYTDKQIIEALEVRMPHDAICREAYDLIQRQRAEVASIFDELIKEARAVAEHYEKSANATSDFAFERIEFRGTQIGALLVLLKISTLKKKYTEET